MQYIARSQCDARLDWEEKKKEKKEEEVDAISSFAPTIGESLAEQHQSLNICIRER